MTSDQVTSKKLLVRQQFRALPELSACDRAYMDERLTERLTQLLRARAHSSSMRSKSAVPVWAAFHAIGSEVDLRPLFAEMKSELQFAFPRVEGDSLAFYLPRGSNALVANRWGILEPDPAASTLVSVESLDGILVPGVAFDTSCNRLGRGKGYYDRTLAAVTRFNRALNETTTSSIDTSSSNSTTTTSQDTSLRTTPITTIGIALDRQISEMDLPTDPHDIAMDWVLTEARLIGRGRGPCSLEDFLSSSRMERKTS